MKTFQIIFVAVVMAMVLSLPASAFAMGGRHGDGGGGSSNSHYSSNNGHGSGNHHESGNNHGSEDDNNHHEGQGGDGIIGNLFFSENDHHDPFGGESHKDQEGDNDQDNDQNNDEEDEGDSIFSFEQNFVEVDQTDNPNDPQVIPEPATISLMLLGGAGAGLLRRKTKT